MRRRQIEHDAVDFASCRRDALREDPVVLLVGEVATGYLRVTARSPPTPN